MFENATIGECAGVKLQFFVKKWLKAVLIGIFILLGWSSSQIQVECLNTLVTIYDKPNEKNRLNGLDFYDENMNHFIQAIALESWMELYKAPDNLKYDTFIKIFSHCFNTNYPIVKLRRLYLIQ